MQRIFELQIGADNEQRIDPSYKDKKNFQTSFIFANQTSFKKFETFVAITTFYSFFCFFILLIIISSKNCFRSSKND